MILNLGCSNYHLKGCVNVDIVQPADVIADLEKRWPWEDSSIDSIIAYDVIEHLSNHVRTMNEMWRVLKPGSIASIAVPTTEGRGAFQDPNHKSFWNRNSFFYYTDKDPHRERFGDAYGVIARFEVMGERTELLCDNVVKLFIELKAVK